MVTLSKSYIKKELTLLAISMTVLLSIIFICYILIQIKHGNNSWVSNRTFVSILAVEFLLGQIVIVMLAVTIVISNYKIYSKKRMTALSLTLLIPSWILLLYSNIRGVIVLPSQPMNIPGEFLYIASLFLVVLILNLAPAYYLRFKYHLYLKDSDDMVIEDST